jgi:hypothetical protein
METSDRHDQPTKPCAPAPGKKKPTILQMMLLIVVVSFFLAYAGSVQRANARLSKINGEFTTSLYKVADDNPPLSLNRRTMSH